MFVSMTYLEKLVKLFFESIFRAANMKQGGRFPARSALGLPLNSVSPRRGSEGGNGSLAED